MFDIVKRDIQRYIVTENVKTRRELVDLFLFNESLWYILFYRLGCWARTECNVPIFNLLLKIITRFLCKFMSIVTGYQIPFEAKIGSGLYIGHIGYLAINSKAVIGNNCNLSAGVIIGEGGRGDAKGAPTLGDFVYVAPGAKIIGKIRVGNNVAVGANAVVVKDVPDGMSVAGIPAKIINDRGSRGLIQV
jgi:serine O-acetyltransferase